MRVRSIDTLRSSSFTQLYREGRFLVGELLVPHRVLSTSVRNGGQRENLRYLVNHQSCEGTDHRERHSVITENGQEAYHDSACSEINLNPSLVAMMGTAANMNYAGIVEQTDNPVTVTAIVTAGVQGNAACAGDPADWRETAEGWEKAVVSGTINTMLLIDHPMTQAAISRAVVTMTEAKSAALQRLSVRSLYSQDMATGTGTDQYCIAAPLDDRQPLTSTSPHVKLGEMIGVAVREATLEALRWQNGLEVSYTRGIFHALGRFGLSESTFISDIAKMLSARDLELLQKNQKSVVYEPLVSSSAYAIAAVLDRIRYGTLPPETGREALRQQAANLSVSLSAKPHRWSEFYALFDGVNPDQPAQTVLKAIALGWSSKWQ